MPTSLENHGRGRPCHVSEKSGKQGTFIVTRSVANGAFEAPAASDLSFYRPQFAPTTRTRVANSGSGEVRSLRPLVVVTLRIGTCSVRR